MTPTPVDGYCTLADLRLKCVMDWPTADTTLDQFFCDIITAASRGVDQECGRYFYKSSAHEVRYFTANDPDRICVGDLVSVTALQTDESAGTRTYPYTWATTDYDLWPYDAAASSEDAPYRWLERTPAGMYTFPVGIAKGVKLDGVFGWPAVPSPVAKATLLQSYRIFKRFSTILGSQSMSALGGVTLKIPELDPDIKGLINNYKIAGF